MGVENEFSNENVLQEVEDHRDARTMKKMEDLRKADSRRVILTDYLLIKRGMGSNPGESMDVCKCIVPSLHGTTINSRRATIYLLRLVEERQPQVSSLKIGVEARQVVLSPVWFSKLQLTTGVPQAFALMNFVASIWALPIRWHQKQQQR
ncbi:hypothetical protein TNCV_1192941 [Trichonephila clavipes]|nr:hypothetical protein TNCV_1192941 [Trichonephila clavipes]